MGDPLEGKFGCTYTNSNPSGGDCAQPNYLPKQNIRSRSFAGRSPLMVGPEVAGLLIASGCRVEPTNSYDKL